MYKKAKHLSLALILFLTTTLALIVTLFPGKRKPSKVERQRRTKNTKIKQPNQSLNKSNSSRVLDPL
jgi:hypothetical protein